MARAMLIALPAVFGVATASAGATMAAVNAGLCTDADASCAPAASSASSASLAHPAEVWLLQVTAGRAVAARMNLPDQDEEPKTEDDEMTADELGVNATNVWDKLKVAARLDKLKTAIQVLRNSNFTEQVKDELKQVLSSLPLVEHLKHLFANQWANVSQVADIEDMSSALLELKSDSVEAGELRRQLQELQEPISNVTIADMQNQVANMWKELQGKGFSFPNLDGLAAHAGDVVKQLVDTVNSTLADGGAMEAVHGLVEEMKARKESQMEAVNGLVEGLKARKESHEESHEEPQ